MCHRDELVVLLALLVGTASACRATASARARGNDAPALRVANLTHEVARPANGALLFWTQLDVPTVYPALTIIPDALGGAEVRDVLVWSDGKSFVDRGARTFYLDARGRVLNDKATPPSAAVIAENLSGTATVGDRTFKGFGLYLAKLNAAGHRLWGATYEDAVLGTLFSTPEGGAIIAGLLMKATSFGGAPIGDECLPKQLFVARFDANGRHIFSRAFDVADPFGKVHVAAHTNGDVTLVGPLWNNADFGGDH